MTAYIAVIAGRAASAPVLPAFTRQTTLGGLRLDDAIRRRAGELRAASGVEIRVRGRAPPLPTFAAAHAYRVVCEAITNALRHAEPQRIDVTFAVSAGSLLLSVADDGRGLAAPPGDSTGLEIRRSFGDDLPPLGPDVQLVIYRVVQESLTNVVRHAQAARATVALSHAGGHVEVRVDDDGIGLRGMDSDRGGIRGMRERALLLGGRLTVGPSAAGGTSVRLGVPVNVNASEAVTSAPREAG